VLNAAEFLKFWFLLSQGSAATHLTCDGQCDMGFVANFSENIKVKKF